MTPRRSPRVLYLASCPCPLRLSLCPCSRALSRSFKLVPCHHLCHASIPIVLFSSALVDIPSVKIPTPMHCTPCLQVSSDLNIKLVSFPLRVFACARAQCSCFLLFSIYGLLTILLSALFPPRLLAVVASCFPFVACYPPFLSCCLILCSLPHVLTIAFVPSSSLCLSSCLLIPPLVLRFSCRITF